MCFSDAVRKMLVARSKFGGRRWADASVVEALALTSTFEAANGLQASLSSFSEARQRAAALRDHSRFRPWQYQRRNMDVDEIINKPSRHPYQCIASVTKGVQSAPNVYLLAACGPRLHSVSLQEGAVVSSWPISDTVSDPLHVPRSL